LSIFPVQAVFRMESQMAGGANEYEVFNPVERIPCRPVAVKWLSVVNLSDIRFPMEFSLTALAYSYPFGICGPLDAHPTRMGPVFRKAVLCPVGFPVFR